MGDKGNVYRCKWEKTADGDYIGWFEKRPKLRVEASDIDEMVRELGEVIGEYFNDQEAALEFEPDLNSGNSLDRMFVDDYVQIGWNAGVTFASSAMQAFTRGRCLVCSNGVGERSKYPLTLDHVGSDCDGACSAISNSSDPLTCNMPASISFVSTSFLSAFKSIFGHELRVRAVQMPKRCRREFFEIVPTKLKAPVALRNVQLGGWRCSTCDARLFSHGKILGWGTDVICRSDLPVKLPSYFFIGDRLNYGLCMRRSAFKALAELPGTRKMTLNRLGIAEVRECAADPAPPTLEQHVAFRKKHKNAGTFKLLEWIVR